jgi:hypothetical protein
MSHRNGFLDWLARFLTIFSLLTGLVLITRIQRGFIYWAAMSVPWIWFIVGSQPVVIDVSVGSLLWSMVLLAALLFWLGNAMDHDGGVTAVVWWLPVMLLPFGIMIFGNTTVLSDGSDGRQKTYRHMTQDCSKQMANVADHGNVYNRDGSYVPCGPMRFYYDNDPRNAI